MLTLFLEEEKPKRLHTYSVPRSSCLFCSFWLTNSIWFSKFISSSIQIILWWSSEGIRRKRHYTLFRWRIGDWQWWHQCCIQWNRFKWYYGRQSLHSYCWDGMSFISGTLFQRLAVAPMEAIEVIERAENTLAEPVVNPHADQSRSQLIHEM